MKLIVPDTLDEACEAMCAESVPPIPIAGGTDVMLSWPDTAHEDLTLLDLSALYKMRSVRWTKDELILGSLTTYWDVITDARIADVFPLLVQAAREIGAIQIQSRGTWGGNVMNASPAADGVLALMVYNAQLVFRSTNGETQYPLNDYYTGYKQLRNRPDELLTSIHVPLDEYNYEHFMKVGQRRALAISKVGVAIVRSPNTGLRIVVNSMAPTVRRCPTIEQLFESDVAIRSPRDILPAVDNDLSPIDDIRSTAEYRRNTLCRILYHERHIFR